MHRSSQKMFKIKKDASSSAAAAASAALAQLKGMVQCVLSF